MLISFEFRRSFISSSLVDAFDANFVAQRTQKGQKNCNVKYGQGKQNGDVEGGEALKIAEKI
jgi:hypothetical protein